MTTKVIVFDWDGTLFNSMGYKPENAAKVFSEYYKANPNDVRSLFLQYSGLPRLELFQNICQSLHLSFLEDDFKILSDMFTKANVHSALSANLFDEVVNTLLAPSQNYSLYISSSSRPEELQIIVKRFSIHQLIKCSWGSLPGFSKGREHFKKICEIENCTLSEILFVGDDQKDRELASQSGVAFCQINRAERAFLDKRVISSLSELNHFIVT